MTEKLAINMVVGLSCLELSDAVQFQIAYVDDWLTRLFLSQN